MSCTRCTCDRCKPWSRIAAFVARVLSPDREAGDESLRRVGDHLDAADREAARLRNAHATELAEAQRQRDLALALALQAAEQRDIACRLLKNQLERVQQERTETDSRTRDDIAAFMERAS